MRRCDYEEVERLYRGGLSTTQVGKQVGISAPSVLRILRLRGVPVRSISEAKVLRALGNRSRQTKGYVFIRLGKSKRRLEHNLIAEKALGRGLRRNEHVHHINRIPWDNRPENLLICSRAYHTWLHWRMRSHPYWSKI